MRIICVEEHVADPDIVRAVHPVLSGIGGYMSGLCTQFQDRPDSFGDGLPHLNPVSLAMDLVRDSGAGRIADMDRHGIDMQVLSCNGPVQFAPAGEAVALARASNDRLAQAIRAYPTRFGGFAVLPWQDPQAAADELDRAVGELGFVGALIVGRPGETFLDDPRYRPVLARLDALRAPLSVHPGLPLPQVQAPYYGGLGGAFEAEVTARLSMFGWGWHNEAGIHVVRMMLAGLFDSLPNLQVISGHWGEMVPFYLNRLDDMIPPGASGLSRTIGETYRAHVSVTPSGMMNLPHFEFIRSVLGIDRILYSIDYPFLTQTGARAFLETLPVGADDRERIAHGNAEALFPGT